MTEVRDALVIGHGLPALLTALDLAEVGLSVVVVGNGEDLPHGFELDPDGVLAAALRRVAAPLEGAGDVPEAAASPSFTPERAPLLLDPAGAWAEQAEPAVLGIPAVPLAERTLRLLGTAGAIRAYRDRIAPLLTIGKTRFFGDLVRKRLGRAALQRLSEPLLRERYGVSADRVEVAIAAPGLNETLSRAGSLTAAALAYSDRNVARETGVAPVAGWERFRELLLQRLVAYGVELRDGAVAEIGGVGAGGPAELGGNADATRSILLEGGEMLHARALVLGFGDDPRSASAAYSPGELMPELAPVAWRTHAEIDILPVEGIPVGAIAVRTVACRTVADRTVADRTVADRTVDEWSLRLEAFDGRSTATVVSTAADRVVDLDEGEYAAMLETAGLVAAPDSPWRVRIGAAPFRTVDERHRAHDALRVRLAEEAELVPLGRVLHGDDLAAAVASAHEAAVHLRRHLLGLED